MNTNRMLNLCYGAGGGTLAIAAVIKQMRTNKVKPEVDKLVETGAKIDCIPCHNCMDQFVK